MSHQGSGGDVRPRVLMVGLACLDIINVVPHYPEEDREVRASSQILARGGNASNSLVVMSQLGASCTLLGTLGSLESSRLALEDMQRHSIDYSLCRVFPECQIPTSYIALSQASGSRTIIHYRNLPELSFEDFVRALSPKQQAVDAVPPKVSLPFDVVHFEARNMPETLKMMRLGRDTLGPREARSTRQIISLEIDEKASQRGAEEAIPCCDVVFFAKAYVKNRGFDSGEKFLRERANAIVQPSTIVVCAWGEHGAWAMDSSGAIHFSPAVPPPNGVVDTIGAGDTFNATMLHQLSLGREVGHALRAACAVAGFKCGQHGFEGVGIALAHS